MAARARVAVLDPLPLFRVGVMAALAPGGLEVAAPADVPSWLAGHARRLVLVSLVRPYPWSLLQEVRKLVPDVPVIALLDPVTDESAFTAIRLGASSVVARDAVPDDLVAAIDVTLAGSSVVPAGALREMAARSGFAATGTVDAVEPRQLEWLTILAAGATVAELARRMDYSERTMFRLLGKLYTQMGVENRNAALMRAHENGWLTGHGP